MNGNIDWTQVVTQKIKTQLAVAQAQDSVLADSMARRLVADAAIASLQDAIDIGEATEAETMLLTAWKQYRLLLSRVPAQKNYPALIDWPIAPV